MAEKKLAEYQDASGRLVFTGKENISYNQFHKLAEKLIKQFKGNVLEKVEDGLSSRYWDVAIENTKICFHYDDMINDFEIISLEQTKSNELARTLALALK